jgi:hypothetical protein
VGGLGECNALPAMGELLELKNFRLIIPDLLEAARWFE